MPFSVMHPLWLWQRVCDYGGGAVEPNAEYSHRFVLYCEVEKRIVHGNIDAYFLWHSKPTLHSENFLLQITQAEHTEQHKHFIRRRLLGKLHTMDHELESSTSAKYEGIM